MYTIAVSGENEDDKNVIIVIKMDGPHEHDDEDGRHMWFITRDAAAKLYSELEDILY